MIDSAIIDFNDWSGPYEKGAPTRFQQHYSTMFYFCIQLYHSSFEGLPIQDLKKASWNPKQPDLNLNKWQWCETTIFHTSTTSMMIWSLPTEIY